MANKITVLIPEGTQSATIVSKSVIGPKGAGIITGSGAPILTDGVIGDFYYDTTNFIFYGPKDESGWGTGLPLDTQDNSDTTLTYTGDLLTRIDKGSGAFKDFSYDTSGDLLTIFDGTLTKTFIYDTNGNVIQILVT